MEADMRVCMTLLFSSALPAGERGQAARLVWNLPRPIKCGPLGLVNPQTWVETDVMVRREAKEFEPSCNY